MSNDLRRSFRIFGTVINANSAAPPTAAVGVGTSVTATEFRSKPSIPPTETVVSCTRRYFHLPAGIENFDKVDAHVYRGAQPTEEGFRYLAS